jgi:hypothetical protein
MHRGCGPVEPHTVDRRELKVLRPADELRREMEERWKTAALLLGFHIEAEEDA